jgi:hypothetical protein
MSKTPEERAAFGVKMAAARATAKAARANSTQKGEVVEMTESRYSEGPPEGVRPIKVREIVRGREVDAGSVAGLQQAPDSGYGNTRAAIEVSGDVLGGGFATGGVVGAAKVSGERAVLFSDSKDDGGVATQLRVRGYAGPAEPTGLPCSCVQFVDVRDPVTGQTKKEQRGMPTELRGQSPSITWCAMCGGERDLIPRPENALKGRSFENAAKAAGVQVDLEAVAQRAYGLIDIDAIANAVASAVLTKIQHDLDIKSPQ